MNKILQDLDDASHRSCSPPEPGICKGGGAPAARFSSAGVTMRKRKAMKMVNGDHDNGNGDHDNEDGDNETFLSPGWASPTWCQSLPRVRSSASIRYLVKTLFTWQVDSRTCQIRDNNNNEQSSTKRQEYQQKYLVISVPPSSAGGLQLTSTLSWKTSVTLQVRGGVGLSGGNEQ